VIGAELTFNIEGQACDCCNKETHEIIKDGYGDINAQMQFEVGFGLGEKLKFDDYGLGYEVKIPIFEGSLGMTAEFNCDGTFESSPADLVLSIGVGLEGNAHFTTIAVDGSARVALVFEAKGQIVSKHELDYSLDLKETFEIEGGAGFQKEKNGKGKGLQPGATGSYSSAPLGELPVWHKNGNLHF
jgi:hypothetical protein